MPAERGMNDDHLKAYIDQLGLRVLAKFLPPVKKKRRFIVKQKYPNNYQESELKQINIL